MILQLSIQVAAALSAALIGGVGLYIARQQYKINKHKLKYDLYDKRYKYFEELKAYLSSVCMFGGVKADDANKFYREMVGIGFLFDDDLVSYVEKTLHHRSGRLTLIQDELQGMPAGDEKIKAAKEKSAILKLFQDDLFGLEKRFSKYLSLENK